MTCCISLELETVASTYLRPSLSAAFLARSIWNLEFCSLEVVDEADGLGLGHKLQEELYLRLDRVQVRSAGNVFRLGLHSEATSLAEAGSVTAVTRIGIFFGEVGYSLGRGSSYSEDEIAFCR